MSAELFGNEDICCPTETRDRRSCLRNLQIITALDSLSYGLLYRFIPNFIQKMGGNHMHIGVLLVGLHLGELISSELTKTFTLGYGKRNRLVFISSVTLLTTLMIATTRNYWVVIVMRVFFSSINKTQSTLLALLLAREHNPRNQDKLMGNYHVLSKWGLVAGPMIAGFLYDRDKGFQEICSFSAILTFTNIVILTTIEQNQKEISEEVRMKASVVGTAKNVIKETIKNLKECDFKTNWDILLVRLLFTGTFLIFISKLCATLKNFFDREDSITTGCTIGLTTALQFAFTYYISRTDPLVYPLVFVSELSLFLVAMFMSLTMLVPCFELFLVLNIPTMFLHSFINSMWLQLFCERNSDALMHLNRSAEVVSYLVFPLTFGVAFEIVMGPYWALLAYTCLPLFLCWVITRSYSRFLKFEKKEDDDVDYCGLGEEVKCI